MVIDIDDYSVRFVGMTTLKKIEKDLQELSENGIKGVLVDFKEKGINVEYTKFLAKLKYNYECELVGIGDKKYDIDKYISTGYFIKETIGNVQYAKWLLKNIENAGYPLMIKDNRLKGFHLVPLNIIQPVKVDEKYFYYNTIKPQYLEPKYLEAAILNRDSIFTRELIGISEMGDKLEGIRFATTERERNILGIFADIIQGRVVGYAG